MLKNNFLFMVFVIFISIFQTARASDPEHLSLMAVISNPDRYDGRYMLVKGYIDVGFESSALYIYQEDYKFSMTKNSVALKLSKEDFEWLDGKRGYVRLRGVYEKEYKGHLSLRSGGMTGLRNIIFLMESE